MSSHLQGIAWPIADIGDALRALCEKAHLGEDPGSGIGSGKMTSGDLPEAIDWYAQMLGCEAERVFTSLRDLDAQLQGGPAAILRLDETSFAAILRGGKRECVLLTPDLALRKVPLAELVSAVRAPEAKNLEEPFERVLDTAGVSGRRRAKALEALTRDGLAARRFEDCWLLRPNPGARAREWLRETGAAKTALGLMSTHTAQYLLWLTSWGVLGALSFSGHMDRGWLLAWALLLMTLAPFRVLTTWLQGALAISVGGALKRRLLLGALRLEPDEMRDKGMGSFLGQVLEAEAVETLALGGGIAGVLAVIEIVVAGFVLGRFALLLAAWMALTVVLGLRFMSRYKRWTDTRMEMTQDVVERMVGHRTRLAQEPRESWHEAEDARITTYLGSSKRIDHTGMWLVTAIPRGWLLAGLACLAPDMIVNKTAASQLAVLLGGVLLAQTGLKRLTGSFVEIAAALVSWQRVGALFRAAGRKPVLGTMHVRNGRPSGCERVVEADRLVFRYRSAGRAALQGLSTAIRRGDRVLLEGPSGGGKTTFASLLSGMREPSAGLLLVNGLDRQSLGTEQWRKAIASAPQFHENYIVTETLAFNLLMGKRWPPTQADVDKARELCCELGLGELLERMPGGMLQMVGEGGWQLSHGERSRIYIARALLQEADLVILDESFAALDPESLGTALECTLKHAKTLMVIAHP